MGMRLIDADALKEQIEGCNCRNCNHYNYIRCRACWIDDAVTYIDDAPTIEQPEQKHGHWIRSPGFRPDFQCSVCKETYVGDCRMFKFCPECSARMDEEVEQE